MNTNDLYWIAGILEGEGCFTVERKRICKFRIIVGMTDLDIIEKLQTITGIGNICQASITSTGKLLWQWQVTRKSDVIGLMMTLYPLMGVRRQARIRELIMLWRNEPKAQRGFNKEARIKKQEDKWWADILNP